MPEDVLDQEQETNEGNQETPEVEAPPEGETPETEAGEPGQEEPAAEGEPEAPAYEPNYTYKAMGEEKEFPDWIKEIVKDPEREEEVRKIFAKAGGLEHFEKKYTDLDKRVAEHYTPMETQYQQQQAGLNTLNKYAQDGDWRSFFKTLGVPDQAVLGYAKDIFEYQDMTPEQRNAIDQQMTVRTENEQLQYQTQQMQQQWQEQQVQMRTMQLDMELNKPDIAPFREKYDTVMGRPGAFKQAVIDRGSNVWNTQNVDLGADALVQQVMELYQGINQVPLGTPAGQPTPAANQVVTQPTTPATLPNIQGGGNSPVKQQVKSLADITRIRQEMEAKQ